MQIDSITFNNLWIIGKRSLDQISVDRNCVLSLDQNYVNHLIEFHLIESVDQNFKKPKIPLLELLIN